MKRLLLLGLVVAGCAGGGTNTPPPQTFEFQGEFFGAAYFCPTHAGNAELSIDAQGNVTGFAYSACDNTTSQVSGTITNLGVFDGALSNPVRDADGNLQLSQDDLTGHLNLTGSAHGLDLHMKKGP
jgi:hypothetical protein